MKVHVIFGQLKEHYEGEYAPDAFEVITEFQYQENDDWLPEKLREARDKWGDEYASIDVITLDVNGDDIRRILLREEVIPADVDAPLATEGEDSD